MSLIHPEELYDCGPVLLSEGVQEFRGYQCLTCKGMYPSLHEAEECYAQKFEPVHAVGDIVCDEYYQEEGGGRFGWFDGDKAWVVGKWPIGADEEDKGMSFYYVVTAVMAKWKHRPDQRSRGQHDPIYIVKTLAMTDGYCGGWTCDEGHIAMVKAKNVPKRVRQQSRALIGWVTDRLL